MNQITAEKSILSKINSPSDLKRLDKNSLIILAKEIRAYIIKIVSQNGGHLASNLGAVELTIALHYIYDSPKDKIIWDVGHQCYTHKILTGRQEKLKTIRQKDGISGFPKHSESAHDIFDTGHSSTSISAGLGLITGQDFQNNKHKVIAVIGDGALTGGLAFEAMNHAGHIGKRLIIILNDNGMSISKNVGAISAFLSRLTATRSYQVLRKKIDKIVQKTLGKRFLNLLNRVKKMFKALLFDVNLFSDFGFEYVGPLNGHEIPELLEVFEQIQNFDKPVVVHIKTKKGKGYPFAENNPSQFHGVGGFSIVDGKFEPKTSLSFTEAFSKSLTNKAKENKKICAITAAMSAGTGLAYFEKHFPRRFYDVGITEQHAVTFSAGLAKSGLRPVVAIYSTFMQRAVDQVIHDVALQGLPVIFALDRAGLVGSDGETHHGLFDIILFRSIPNTEFLSPANASEMDLMLEYALNQSKPLFIRYPRLNCFRETASLKAPLIPGRGVFLNPPKSKIILLTLGSTLELCKKLSYILAAEDMDIDIYNMRFINPIDEDYLLDILKPYDHIYFIEEAYVHGGLGEYLQCLLTQKGLNTPFYHYGLPNQFIEHGTREELLQICGLSPDQLAETIMRNFKQAGGLKIFKKTELIL